MKLNGISTELQQSMIEKLTGAENKSAAIVEVIEELNEARHKDLIAELQAENEELKANRQLADKMGYRQLTKGEKSFYEKIQQSVTLDSKDVIPNEIIDITLKDVHEQSDVLKLVNFAPAGVNKWLSGSHTGAATWGKLTDTLTNELTASITSLQMDVNKMYVLLIVPKSIRELALPLVDKYFTAVLTEAMRDGIVAAYLNGNGVNQPIGLTYKLPDGGNAVIAKDVRTDVTDFQSGLGIIKTALANGGKRTVGKVYCIANPSTAYQYVEPALYVMTGNGRISTALTEVELIIDTNAPEGKAIFTIENAYTMGLRDVRIDEYKETKAIDDADLFIAKAYGNGRPDDDATAVIVDATKLEAYAYPTKAKTSTKG